MCAHLCPLCVNLAYTLRGDRLLARHPPLSFFALLNGDDDVAAVPMMMMMIPDRREAALRRNAALFRAVL